MICQFKDGANNKNLVFEVDNDLFGAIKMLIM